MIAKISVLINTFNEELNIRNCLESVKWADEIVIVDMHSTDKTVEIAREYTDKIFYFDNVGFADPARQFGVERTTNDWVLIVDADELVPKQLRDRLVDIASSDSADVVSIPHKNYYFGELSMQSPCNDMHTRFFKKQFVTVRGVVHDMFAIAPSAYILKLSDPEQAFVHFAYVEVKQHLEKFGRYTILEAKNTLDGDKHDFDSGFKCLLRMVKVFLREYFKKGEWKTGWAGFYWSVMAASYVVVSRMNLLLMRRYNSKTPEMEIRKNYQGIADAVIAKYSTEPKVAIVIVNYKCWVDTAECLESVFKNDYANCRIIVVDNNSGNGSMDYLRAWADGKICTWTRTDNPLRDLSQPPQQKPVPYIFLTAAQAAEAKPSTTADKQLVFIQTADNLGFAGGNNVGIRYAMDVCGCAY